MLHRSGSYQQVWIENTCDYTPRSFTTPQYGKYDVNRFKEQKIDAKIPGGIYELDSIETTQDILKKVHRTLGTEFNQDILKLIRKTYNT